MERDPLGLDAEQMRTLGYQTVDMLVDQLRDPGRLPVITTASRDEMARRLGGPAPHGGETFDRILERVTRDVLTAMVRHDHPGYLAFIPAHGTWPGALGDFIASALNLYGGSWKEGAGPSQLEVTVLDWFKDWIGYPAGAGGNLVSGGSQANLTALVCARENLAGPMSDRLVMYLTDQAHSSMTRAARILGFRPEQTRLIPIDDQYRMRPELLEAAIVADRAAGRQPFFVGAAAGTTNTGAIDPLPELAAVCHAHDLWFHVDGAYGAFAILTERGRGWLRGIEQADSITLDPHKWLYQPFECGCLLVRDVVHLQHAFEITPDYLRDTKPGGPEVNFVDLGVQLTRMLRALKVWMSISYFGLDGFRQAIDRSIDLAAHARARIEATTDFELLAPPSLSIVCFRRRFAGIDDEAEIERRNRAALASLEASGRAWISSTRLGGRYALRLCVLNHNTQAINVDEALDLLERTVI